MHDANNPKEYRPMIIDADIDTCIAFLIRHGATHCNQAEPPILQGRTIDGPLSTTGQRQADQTAACLSRQPLSAVYSSPLRRAVETAERVARPHGLAVRTIDDICEVDVGAWERRSWTEIMRSEPELYASFQRDPARHGYRDGENLTQLAERVIPAIQQVMQSHRGQTIAIVGHNVVNRVILAHALQLPLSRARVISQENGGINTVRSCRGEIKALSINSVFHLVDGSPESIAR
jgi:broad specificity phosphatase PhoE